MTGSVTFNQNTSNFTATIYVSSGLVTSLNLTSPSLQKTNSSSWFRVAARSDKFPGAVITLAPGETFHLFAIGIPSSPRLMRRIGSGRLPNPSVAARHPATEAYPTAALFESLSVLLEVVVHSFTRAVSGTQCVVGHGSPGSPGWSPAIH